MRGANGRRAAARWGSASAPSIGPRIPWDRSSAGRRRCARRSARASTARFPNNGHMSTWIAMSDYHIGRLHGMANRLAEAHGSYRSALELQEKRLDTFRGRWEMWNLACTCLEYGNIQRAMGDAAEAGRLIRRGRELLERLPDKGGLEFYNLACAHSLESAAVGRVDGNRGPEDLIESRRSADLAIAALRQAVRAGWKNVGHAKQD